MPRAVPAAVFVTLLLILLVLAAWQLSFVLLLAFAGILLAVLLRHLALVLSRHTPVSTSAGVLVVALGIAALLVLGIVFLGPQLFGQVDQVIRSLPAALGQAEALLQQYSWGQFLLERVPTADERPNWNILGTISGTVSTVVGVLANMVIVVTVAIFLASDPQLYRRGVLHLIPLDKRERAAEIMDALGQGLWRWLIGQGVAMATVAVLSGLGLWLIGVPLAMGLGLIAGLMDFIPYVGPWLGAAPAVLLALAQGPTEAAYTALLFLVIQQVEGNVLMPVIQKRASALPPVLTILAVVAFGVLFGFMGVLLATPLLLVTIILVRMIYVEDVLGDHSIEAPEEEAAKKAS
ncbi:MULTISPECIES: AI-2E family transporter [unclassified Paracoccus (in: a-proteobacteria)]|uniref:AI-2E family transporter n=1 Tax=unclassified Paracoccus (in: a-proteobacteria) TaxID=2688777 RepID=UPI0016046411|nr:MULTISPECIES: AI-2E family transporter [unclassified Paracoccus (in: a-proteobacteria)]MBB1489983.1 AI-2E family transporter [Paracoccus sp. MC1854]MBB1496571.1 AI-2E family transporter [Paracoccus sp. MC1862]QQO43594.1 AI-2E family transporter [Paracoccus sp. MC1862]